MGGSSKVFFISDTHFNHANIMKYCDREFKSVEEMNKTIIKNWNATVKNSDVVYFLGDFCLGGVEQIEFFAKQLNGRKRMVCGNHDRSPSLYLAAGFEEVSRNTIIVDEFFIASHKPVFLNPKIPYVNIHGHIHNTTQILLNDEGKNLYFNVSVEMINYTPINFELIKEYYSDSKALLEGIAANKAKQEEINAKKLESRG